MVQVNDKYGENIVNFPKNQNLEGDLILTLHSELTQKTYTFNVADEGNSKRFYKFIVDFSDVDNGEYDYSINGLETGLIRIGLVSSSTPEVIEYTDEVDIIQYREDRSSQYRLQNKEVTYEDNGQYLVNPDYGYYGLKNVIVNVSIDVDEYYQEGYISGVTDGYVSGKTDGYNSGYTEGYESGSTDGKVIGYNSGYTDGFATGYTSGSTDGYNSGYTNGFSTGYTSGSTDGYNSGYTKGVEDGGASGYTLGYNSGYTDGIAEQKAKLIGLNITSNGNYIRSDGYSAITVNVPTGSTINNQNKNINIVNNGTTSVTFDSGYTGLGTVGINVNVPTGHTDEELEEAYESGITYQKSLLTSTAITENGIYTRANGYSSVNVDVPTTSGISYHQVSVTITSNDPSGLIDNAVVYLANTEQSLSKTYTGSTLDFDVLPGLSYSISFGGVQDYTAPDLVSGTSSWGGSSSVIGYYEYTASPSGYSDQYFTIEAVEGGNLVTYGNGVKNGYYSKNDGEWIEFTFGATSNTIAMVAGDKIRVKCDDVPAGGGVFYSDGGLVVNVYGNIMSLAYGDNFSSATTLNTSSAFNSLFARGSNYHLEIVDAGNLIIPVVSLPSGCCNYMFRNCSRLTKAPALPATTIGSSCYEQMFLNCTSLTTAPDLPVLNLPYHCYRQMFMGCTSLIKAPIISGNKFTGSGSMQSMFAGCTSLTTSPDLNILDIYDSTTYNDMFSNCTSLNYIKCLGKLGNTTEFTSFTYNVASTGTFVKKTGVTWATGTMGIPTGWTVLEEE